jgi:hypothetical protein
VQFLGVGADDRVRAYSRVRSLGDKARALAGGLLPEAEERKFLAEPCKGFFRVRLACADEI